MLSVDEQMRIITSGAAQIVPEADLRKKLEKGEPLNIKLGVDPTSPDLHLGHAVPLRKMRQFQDLGHNVTLIIGNGTALIGDPSGKNSTRPQLSQEQIEANAETYVSQAMKILDPEETTIVHYGDWILSMDLAGLLQVCSKFTVARILERDDFTKRYQGQTPIALHEFLYPVMQAYDSVMVKADVEMGGSDQLFNLLAGRELMEKMGMEPQIALTMPLLEGTELSGARCVLINITASKSLKMSEVRDAVRTVQAFAAPEAFVKYGTVFDDTMEDRIRITVVATGLGAPRAARQPVMQVVQGTGTYGPSMGGGSVDMNNLDVPAVMRSGRRSTVEAMSTSGVGTYDIPAFLRRQAD